MPSQKKITVKAHTKQLKKQTLKTLPPHQPVSLIQEMDHETPDLEQNRIREQDDVLLAPKANHSFFVLRYFSMMLGIAASLAFILHCFLVPFLLPMLGTIFYGTVFAQDLHLVAMGLTFLVSNVAAFVITEKVQSHVGNGLLQANDVLPSRDFNTLYQEKRAIPLEKIKSMTHQYDHQTTQAHLDMKHKKNYKNEGGIVVPSHKLR